MSYFWEHFLSQVQVLVKKIYWVSQFFLSHEFTSTEANTLVCQWSKIVTQSGRLLISVSTECIFLLKKWDITQNNGCLLDVFLG